MKNIAITGWQRGFQKISMTKLIRAYTDCDLAQGKHSVDDVLEGKTARLKRLIDEQAERFVLEARELGAIYHSETITAVLAAHGK